MRYYQIRYLDIFTSFVLEGLRHKTHGCRRVAIHLLYRPPCLATQQPPPTPYAARTAHLFNTFQPGRGQAYRISPPATPTPPLSSLEFRQSRRMGRTSGLAHSLPSSRSSPCCPFVACRHRTTLPPSLRFALLRLKREDWGFGRLPSCTTRRAYPAYPPPSGVSCVTYSALRHCATCRLPRAFALIPYPTPSGTPFHPHYRAHARRASHLVPAYAWRYYHAPANLPAPCRACLVWFAAWAPPPFAWCLA